MKLILLTPPDQQRFAPPGRPFEPSEVPDGLGERLLAMGAAQRPPAAATQSAPPSAPKPPKPPKQKP